jgi:glutaredoxin
MRTTFLLTLLLTPLLQSTPACSPTATDSPPTEMPSRVPIVRPDSGHLIFSWFEDGQGRTATSRAEVPESARGDVRVQDPTIPPDLLNPDIVFIADLTTPEPDGTFPVVAISRGDYEARRKPGTPENQNAAPAEPIVSGAGEVIMYATVHCPHCHRARRWLLEQKIPYREIDIEKNTAAAAALEEKGRAQGVATGGVPMFEINEQLLPGFNPDAIRKALSSPATATPPPPAAPLPGSSKII